MKRGVRLAEERKFRTEGGSKVPPRTKPVAPKKAPPSMGKVAKKAGKIGVAMYAASALKDAYANRNKPKPKGKAK